MRYAMLLFLTVSTWGLSCGLRADREQEPNNTPEQATAVRGQRAVQARLSGEQDRDFFVIRPKQKLLGGGLKASDGTKVSAPEGAGERDESAEPGFLVHVQTVAAEGGDLVLSVFRGEEPVKVIDDRRRGDRPGSEREAFAAYYTAQQLRSGEAVIAVAGAEGTVIPVDYELTVTLEPVQQAVEREPNDRMVTATPLGAASVVRGYYSPAFRLTEGGREQEVDWYSFQVPGEGEQRVFHLSVSAVPDVDAAISLYDELGYLIRRGDSNGPGEGEKLKSLGLGAGTYYVQVSGDRGQENSRVGYVLKLESEPVSGEQEPNDRYTHANRLIFDRDMTGFINPAGDVDWYRLVLYETRRQVITAKVGPTANIDPVLELYRGHDEQLILVDDRGRDEGEIIKNLGVREGIYYLRVSSGHAGEQNPNDPYTLLVEKREWSEDEEFEINNTIEQADVLVLGGLKRGYITPRGDRDFYSFFVERPGKYTFEVSPVLLLDLALHVYDDQGQLLNRINQQPVEEGEQGTVHLEAGQYYISVVNMNAYENSRDAYVLRASYGGN